MRYRSQLVFSRYLRRPEPTDTQPTLHIPRRNRVAPFEVLRAGFRALAYGDLSHRQRRGKGGRMRSQITELPDGWGGTLGITVR